MNNSALIEKIRQLGFSEYEARCYLALLERESLTVSEISRLAEIPRPNAYEALEKLMAKGIVVSIPGNMKRYAASDPWFLREKSLENLDNSLEAELESLEEKRKELLNKKKAAQENIDGLTNELDSLFKGSRSNGSPLNYIEVLKDPLRIHHRAIQLCYEAKKEMLAFTKPPYSFTTREQQEEQKRPQIEALRKGVKIRTIYELPADKASQAALLEAASDFISHGEEARLLEELPIKLAVFDEKIALFTLVDPIIGKPAVTSLVAEHHALAKSFKMLFESFWEKARDYYVINNRKVYLSRSGKKGSHNKTKGDGSGLA
jgi:sugar-specific transcriptional regulator TrmB